MGPVGIIIYIVAIVAFMYFVMIRPESKRKKEQEALRSSIKVGDEITTIGGIIGTVVNASESKIVIETGADRVRIELTRWSISSKNEDEDEEKAD